VDQNTIRKCAEMAATQQRSFLGAVDQDILDLLAELNPVEEVAPVVEETPAVVDEAPAEETPAESSEE